MLGTTVLIPSALVPQMGGRNVSKGSFLPIACAKILFQSLKFVILAGREGEADPDNTVCSWIEHVAPNSLRN